MAGVLRIMILDDDVDLAESLADILEVRGHTVLLAHNGAQAVEVALGNDFDIGFFDVRMPGINGVDAFLEIKKAKPSARICMMTGFSVEDLLDKAIANGALGVLRKPFEISEIMGKLETVQDGLIVVADGDREFVRSIVPFLEQQGYRTATARSGRKAIELVMAGGVTMLILDLNLPVLSGLEVCRELEKKGVRLPTIFVKDRAARAAKDMAALQKYPVRGVLQKPLDPKKLLAEIDAINETLLERVNDSGQAYLTHTRLDGRYVIRFAIGQTATEWRHVAAAWTLLGETARGGN